MCSFFHKAHNKMSCVDQSINQLINHLLLTNRQMKLYIYREASISLVWMFITVSFRSGGGDITQLMLSRNWRINVLTFLSHCWLKETYEMSFLACVSGYFFDGQGISEAARFHAEKMELADCIEADLADATKNPKYRTVKHWYTQWRTRHHGPRTGDGMVDVSIVYTVQFLREIRREQILKKR